MHLERSRDIHLSLQYCTNHEKRSGRLFTAGFSISQEQIDVIQEDQLHEWQRELVTELGTVPDRRRIIWYTDTEGGTGKTELCRYIILRLKQVLFLTSASGKDLIHQVIKAKKDPKIVLFNLSRQTEGAFSYASVESIKDGLVFSGKYEGGMRIFQRPHVVIFANWLPDYTKLSLDRWDVRHLLANPPRRIQ